MNTFFFRYKWLHSTDQW